MKYLCARFSWFEKARKQFYSPHPTELNHRPKNRSIAFKKSAIVLDSNYNGNYSLINNIHVLLGNFVSFIVSYQIPSKSIRCSFWPARHNIPCDPPICQMVQSTKCACEGERRYVAGASSYSKRNRFCDSLPTLVKLIMQLFTMLDSQPLPK